MNVKQGILILASAIVMISACKKKDNVPATDPPVIIPDVSATQRANLTRDSIFLYAKELYLWNTNLPTYAAFNPQKYTNYTNALDNYDEELFEISKYGAPYDYKPGASYPKYSYISDQADDNPVAMIQTSSVDLEGNGNDIGLRVGYYGVNDQFIMYVTAVYDNSPAEAAGFKRGDRITKINGSSYGSNFDAQYPVIYDALNNTSVKLEGIKADGNPFTNTLVKTVFKSSPIYKSTTLTVGNKKIGYLAYARFSSQENSVSKFNAIFNDFATAGVSALVIDLRYNGGGYISTAQHLINLIAPATANGRVMFTEHYNALMQANNAQILTNQPLLDANGKLRYQNGRMLTYADVDYSVAENTYKFEKKGTLTNLQDIVFIVSGNTASASELVINSLKPFMNVKLVGATTYGKPVGFFPIVIENKYDVYYSLFETKNSSGQGGYYDGMVPNVSISEVSTGSIMFDFGNVQDAYLKKALELLVPNTGGTSSAVADKSLSVAKERSLALPIVDVIDSKFDNKEFKGMVENRLKVKN